MSSELGEAFGQVRAGYSVVWAYQRRLFDLLDVVDREIAGQGLVFKDWRPWRASPPPRKSTKFFQSGTWAWDMLPGMATKLRWFRDRPEEDRQDRLVIWTDANTAFDYSGGGEPDPAAWSVDDADSVMHVYLWDGPLSGTQWEAAATWADGQGWEEWDSLLAKKISGEQYRLHAWELSLERLDDADSIGTLLTGRVLKKLPPRERPKKR